MSVAGLISNILLTIIIIFNYLKLVLKEKFILSLPLSLSRHWLFKAKLSIESLLNPPNFNHITQLSSLADTGFPRLDKFNFSLPHPEIDTFIGFSLKIHC